eukprot:3412529-Rhodomonas_salina.2
MVILLQILSAAPSGKVVSSGRIHEADLRHFILARCVTSVPNAGVARNQSNVTVITRGMKSSTQSLVKSASANVSRVRIHRRDRHVNPAPAAPTFFFSKCSILIWSAKLGSSMNTVSSAPSAPCPSATPTFFLATAPATSTIGTGGVDNELRPGGGGSVDSRL